MEGINSYVFDETGLFGTCLPNIFLPLNRQKPVFWSKFWDAPYTSKSLDLPARTKGLITVHNQVDKVSISVRKKSCATLGKNPLTCQRTHSVKNPLKNCWRFLIVANKYQKSVSCSIPPKIAQCLRFKSNSCGYQIMASYIPA